MQDRQQKKKMIKRCLHFDTQEKYLPSSSNNQNRCLRFHHGGCMSIQNKEHAARTNTRRYVSLQLLMRLFAASDSFLKGVPEPSGSSGEYYLGWILGRANEAVDTDPHLRVSRPHFAVAMFRGPFLSLPRAPKFLISTPEYRPTPLTHPCAAHMGREL